VTDPYGQGCQYHGGDCFGQEHGASTSLLCSQDLCGLHYGSSAEGASFGTHGFLVRKTIALRYFSLLFTLFCFALFAMPIWIMFTVSHDPNLRLWITDSLWVVLFLPALYLLTYLVHLVGGVPNKMLILLSTVGSCAVLLLLANGVVFRAWRVGGELAKSDCATSPVKQDMEEQWQAARAFFHNCIANTAASTGASIDELPDLYHIDSCSGYKEQLPIYPYWPYFALLEVEQYCAGWCTPGPPLWSSTVSKDPCAPIIADVMYLKIQRSMTQVIIYTFIAFGIVLMFIALIGPMLAKYGIGW